MGNTKAAVRLIRGLMIGVASLAAVASCLGPAPSDPVETPTVPNKFTALIDDVRWQPYSVTLTANQYGGFTLTGSELFSLSRMFVTISVGHVTGVGSYPITGGVGPFDGGEASLLASGSGAIWNTRSTGSSGTLTVTTATESRVAGTFQFVAMPTAGFGGNRTVTQGEFDLPIGTSGIQFTELNEAYRFAANIDGVSFTPRSVGVFSIVSDGRLAVSVYDGNSGSIGFDVSDFTGVGTYALGSGALRAMTVTRAAPSNQYFGGTNALSSGTVVVTSYVAGTTVGTTRVVGTFAATLQPSLGSAGAAPVQVSGSFDVRK